MIENQDNYEYIILCPNYQNYDIIEQTDKIIKIQKNNKYYGKLKDFVCVGKYYY